MAASAYTSAGHDPGPDWQTKSRAKQTEENLGIKNLDI
jgi:hypothetical protein